MSPAYQGNGGALSWDAGEIWFHEECILWAPGIHIIGSKIVGLEEIVHLAADTVSFYIYKKHRESMTGILNIVFSSLSKC